MPHTRRVMTALPWSRLYPRSSFIVSIPTFFSYLFGGCFGAVANGLKL